MPFGVQTGASTSSVFLVVRGAMKAIRILRRCLLLVLAAMPGCALALGAKPLILGEGALITGVLLAFALPAASSLRLPIPSR